MCINQILYDVNCKDDNEMKYFNNLLIVFAIISSTSSSSSTGGWLGLISTANCGTLSAQRDAATPPSVSHLHVHHKRAYRVRLIIIYRDLPPPSDRPSFCLSVRGIERSHKIIGLQRSRVITNVNLVHPRN